MVAPTSATLSSSGVLLPSSKPPLSSFQATSLAGKPPVISGKAVSASKVTIVGANKGSTNSTPALNKATQMVLSSAPVHATKASLKGQVIALQQTVVQMQTSYNLLETQFKVIEQQLKDIQQHTNVVATRVAPIYHPAPRPTYHPVYHPVYHKPIAPVVKKSRVPIVVGAGNGMAWVLSHGKTTEVHVGSYYTGLGTITDITDITDNGKVVGTEGTAGTN